MRLFRAQRNFYISGFALFLCLVIRRLVSLISVSATLEAEREAAMKQAQSASRAAETLMDSGAGGKADSEAEKKLKAKDEGLCMNYSTNEWHLIISSFVELKKAKKDLESMKTQAENVAAEYDRLMAEKDRIERQLRIAGGASGDDKKGD